MYNIIAYLRLKDVLPGVDSTVYQTGTNKMIVVTDLPSILAGHENVVRAMSLELAEKAPEGEWQYEIIKN